MDPWHFVLRSGSKDLHHWLTDPDPALFVRDLKIPTNFLVFFKFFVYYFLVHLHHFSKVKSHKDVTKIRNQGFSYYFCLMMEGAGSGSVQVKMDPDPGGLKTYGPYGSGSTTLPRIRAGVFTSPHHRWCQLGIRTRPSLSDVVIVVKFASIVGAHYLFQVQFMLHKLKLKLKTSFFFQKGIWRHGGLLLYWKQHFWRHCWVRLANHFLIF